MPKQSGGRVRQGFANRLKHAREARYETAQDFAIVIGLEAHTYRKYERGDSEPPIAVLGQMAVALGVSVDYLILGKRWN